MWWQLFIVLVATTAASAEENEEDRPNCMSVLYRECEEEEEKLPDGLPGNEEELEEFCKYALKYFDCGDRVFSSCDGENRDFARYIGELGAVIRRVCGEDPLLRTAVVAILPCFKENLQKIQRCHEGFYLDQEAFSDAVNEIGITITEESEDVQERSCLSILYGTGCTAATTGQYCGDVAKDVVLNVVQTLDAPFEVCPAGAKEKIPEIVEVMLLEVEKAKSVENTLKKKK